MESRITAVSQPESRRLLSNQAAAILDLYRHCTGRHARTRDELDKWMAGNRRVLVEHFRAVPGAIDGDEPPGNVLLRHIVRGAHLIGV